MIYITLYVSLSSRLIPGLHASMAHMLYQTAREGEWSFGIHRKKHRYFKGMLHCDCLKIRYILTAF